MWRRFFLVALSALGGCGGDSSPDPAALWCGGLCESEQRCGYTNNRPECVNDCLRARPGLRTFSDSGLAAWAPCLATLSCAAIAGDQRAWDSEMEVCWEEATHKVPVSSRVRTFCEPYSQALFECGSWFSVAACERNFSMFGDPVISLLQSCLYQTACEPLEACVDSVLNAP